MRLLTLTVQKCPLLLWAGRQCCADVREPNYPLPCVKKTTLVPFFFLSQDDMGLPGYCWGCKSLGQLQRTSAVGSCLAGVACRSALLPSHSQSRTTHWKDSYICSGKDTEKQFNEHPLSTYFCKFGLQAHVTLGFEAGAAECHAGWPLPLTNEPIPIEECALHTLTSQGIIWDMFRR